MYKEVGSNEGRGRKEIKFTCRLVVRKSHGERGFDHSSREFFRHCNAL
jgi:hypothetical protein